MLLSGDLTAEASSPNWWAVFHSCALQIQQSADYHSILTLPQYKVAPGAHGQEQGRTAASEAAGTSKQRHGEFDVYGALIAPLPYAYHGGMPQGVRGFGTRHSVSFSERS